MIKYSYFCRIAYGDRFTHSKNYLSGVLTIDEKINQDTNLLKQFQYLNINISHTFYVDLEALNFLHEEEF